MFFWFFLIDFYNSVKNTKNVRNRAPQARFLLQAFYLKVTNCSFRWNFTTHICHEHPNRINIWKAWRSLPFNYFRGNVTVPSTVFCLFLKVKSFSSQGSFRNRDRFSKVNEQRVIIRVYLAKHNVVALDITVEKLFWVQVFKWSLMGGSHLWEVVANGGLNVFIDTGHIPQVRVKVPSLTHK